MDTPEPTELPVQDDQVADTSPSVTATASKSASPSLPPGWDKDKVDDDMTGIILGLSLSLAVALIIFMMAIVRWRQKRHKRRDKDAENTSSVLDGRSVEESEDLKRARAQQRLWAKASAKWVANVRQSARRRRRMAAAAKDLDGRVMREAQASTSAVSLARTHTAHDVDRRSSRASSLRRSSIRPRSRSPSPASSYRHREGAAGGALGEPTSPPHYPPAYLQSSSSNSASATYQHHPHVYSRWRSHPLDIAPDSHYHAAGAPPPPPLPPPLHPESDSSPPCSADRSPPPPLSPLPYEPPVHSAHVAVDDKAVLARLAHFASAPPPAPSHADSAVPSHPEQMPGDGGSSEMRPSVPVLDDDPFEGTALGIEFDVVASLPSDRRPVLGLGLRHGLASQAHDTSSAPPHGTPAPPHQCGLDPRFPGFNSVPMGAMAEEGFHDPADGEVPSYAEDVRQHGPLLVLPPPPAKVPLTGPLFYEYPDEFERDVETVEPLDEPSAPPFGEPSSPPLPAHAPMITPSAPPLEYVDEAPPGSEGLLPSAPPLDFEDDGSGSGCGSPSPILAYVPAVSHSGHHLSEPLGGSGGVARSAPLSPSPDDRRNARARGSASTNGAAAEAREDDSEEGEAEPGPPRYLP
ncbi:hypothetical protein BV20DRAFT_270810 [Pilatotrama ljubarskyi]|nr:hypothetical protein BV20DRAFT_270810 [Pilatotrama ljubarskyi]